MTGCFSLKGKKNALGKENGFQVPMFAVKGKKNFFFCIKKILNQSRKREKLKKKKEKGKIIVNKNQSSSLPFSPPFHFLSLPPMDITTNYVSIKENGFFFL